MASTGISKELFVKNAQSAIPLIKACLSNIESLPLRAGFVEELFPVLNPQLSQLCDDACSAFASDFALILLDGGIIGSASSAIWSLDARERSMLFNLCRLLPTGCASRDLPLFLPVTSPNVPLRLLSFAAASINNRESTPPLNNSNSQLFVLCGSLPAISVAVTWPCLPPIFEWQAQELLASMTQHLPAHMLVFSLFDLQRKSFSLLYASSIAAARQADMRDSIFRYFWECMDDVATTAAVTTMTTTLDICSDEDVLLIRYPLGEGRWSLVTYTRQVSVAEACLQLAELLPLLT